MANYVLCLLLQRTLIPLFLIAAVISRPVGFSFAYLIFLFVFPYVPVATPQSLKGWTGIYLKALIAFSTLFCLTVIIFHSTIAIMHAEYIFDDETVLRLFGLVNFHHMSALSIFHWTVPEFVIFVVSILLFTILKKISKNRKQEQNCLKTILVSSSNESIKCVLETHVLSEEKQNILVAIGKYSSLFALCLSGAIQPSLSSIVYFGTFLGASTWLGCNLKLKKIYGYILKIISWYQILHISLFIFYQNPWPQEFLPERTLTARLLGLYGIFISTKDSVNELQIRKNLKYDQILNPIILLITYLIISFSSEIILEREKRKSVKLNSKKLEKTSPQISEEHNSPVKVNKNISDRKNRPSYESNSESHNKFHYIKMYGEFVYKNFCDIFYNNFYIVTNVSMMIWSIVYHSWFGFVLLIWSNAVWIASKQRELLLKTSPFLVAYGVSLILINFIYGLNLTDDELPKKLYSTKTNLIQIGLIKYTSYPVFPLLIKSLFTISFWVLLRQMISERSLKQQQERLINFEISRDDESKPKERQDSETVKKIAKILNRIFVFCWVWIIISILFMMAITGEKMTLLRIIDMTFFFVYLLVFQVSLKWWIKSMYVFWSILVTYSMAVLILVYSYQFDNFPDIWESLNISLSVQEDLGFKQYKTKDLFLKLLTFTSVIILTGMQLNYYHDEFIKMHQHSTKTSEETSTDTFISLKYWQNKIKKGFEAFLLLLEIHFYKIIFIITFCICLRIIQVINLVIMFLALIGIQTKSDLVKKIIVRTISITSMLFIYCIMFYQLDNVVYPEEGCEANITETKININLKGWFGFTYGPLFSIIWPYFLYIVLITLNSGLIRRQKNIRQRMNKSLKTPYIVFENISRSDADKSIFDLMKFLVNYCFYKFGVELTLIMFMIIILHRLDGYAFFYAFWFCIIAFKNQNKLERVWHHTIFWLTACIILQCLILNGVSPNRICLDEKTKNFLHNNVFQIIEYNKKHQYVLIFDIFLLMLMSCQLTVFKINKEFDEKYPLRNGGSNRLVHDRNNTDNKFSSTDENPLPNFLIKVRKPIDILKQIIFKGTYWITLTVVFLAGTYRVDLFSLGYLAGSFTFFWCGTEFYLKPMAQILKWWNFMFAYNIFVIIMKLFVKFFACLFSSNLPQSICWMIDILGISCSHLFDENKFSCDHLLDGYDLLWDGLAFVFLIFQKRIFLSFYFCHVVDETVKTDILSSRGAEIIEELRLKSMQKEYIAEAATLEKIKLKMEKLKLIIKKPNEEEPKFHHQAIRACDYSMFDEVHDDDDDYDDDMLSETEEPLVTKSDLNKSTSKKNDFEINKNQKRLMQVKRFLNKLTMHFVCKIHKLSRKYSYVIRILAHERKLLDGPLNAALIDPKSSTGRMLSNINKANQISIMAKVDQYFQKYVPGKFVDRNEIEIIELIKVIFYFLFSHTDLMVYLVVFFNQISSASILALPMSMFVFLWGTLTFPRPSKTFWILLIAYTQTVILIKCVSQFESLWWNWDENISSPRNYIKLLGNERKKWFASYDLALLLFIFIHRIVMKTFGLWKSYDDFEIGDDGCYNLEHTDEKTQDLMKYYFKNGISTSQDSIRINDINPESNSSRDYLIQKENNNEIKVISRHEINTTDENSNLLQIKNVYCNKKELLKAKFEIDQDLQGSHSITLRQDHVSLKIRPFECPKMYQQPKEKCIIVDNTIEEPSDFSPNIFLLSFQKHVSHLKNFIKTLVQKRSRKVVDVYMYMFMCEFINFFVLLFGYSDFALQFEENRIDNNVITYIEDNEIPTSLLFILLVQFLLIIFDRALYLRKNMIGKVIFHFCIIFAIHIWMFFLLPATTGRSFNSTAAPIIYYIFKCIYLLLSAFQIRCGYPARILGNFQMKHYNIKHLIGFKLFMLTPFLYEIRTLTDWVFTDTSLTISEWLNVESIYSKIFMIKCNRNTTGNIPRGTKEKKYKKYLIGGGLTMTLILLLWFPLALFAYSGALGQQSIPSEVSVSFRIGNFESIYEAVAEKDNILPFNDGNWNNISSIYSKRSVATSFLNQYKPEDVVAVRLISNSSKIWNISPSQRNKLLMDLKSTTKVVCRFTYIITHLTLKTIGAVQQTGYSEYKIESSVREKLVEMLENQNNTKSVEIPQIFPKILNVQKSGKIKPIPQLSWSDKKSDQFKSYYRNIILSFYETDDGDWWQIKEQCNDKLHQDYFVHFPNGDCKHHMTMYLFNDKVFPSAFNKIAVKGIAGLYATIILVTSRSLRNTIFMNRSSSIIIEELPNVDRILILCKDIYLARESMDFKLEEDLYAKLIFLYRTPDTLIKWTKQKNQ